MKILVLDNNVKPEFWGARDLVAALRRPGLEIHTRRPAALDYPSAAAAATFDALVVSGSLTRADAKDDWVIRETNWVLAWLDSGKPFLGVCFGHQLMCRALQERAGVREAVGPAATAEHGDTKIQVTDRSRTRLFRGLPEMLVVQSAHQDEVRTPPSGWLVTARSDACAVQAIEHPERWQFGVQFHPERAGSKPSNDPGPSIFKTFLNPLLSKVAS